MKDEIFDIDIDVNVRDNARNAIDPISRVGDLPRISLVAPYLID
jgi:hypothetical protein